MMKTYQLTHPLERTRKKDAIPFEHVFYNQHWLIFNPHKMQESLTFDSDGTFIVRSQSGKASKGQWIYKGGDAFKLTLDNGTYGLHLVHLDNNLMMFELHDTKQYFILVSEQCLKTINLNTLDAIEYYIGKLNAEISEQLKNPEGFQRVASHVVPIMVMGGLYHNASWFHESNHEHQDKDDNHVSQDVYQDELDDEVELDLALDDFDESIEDEGIMEDDFVNVVDNNSYDDVEYEEPLYDEEDTYEEGYGEYGDFSEEEIIYDYLQSQEEEDE